MRRVGHVRGFVAVCLLVTLAAAMSSPANADVTPTPTGPGGATAADPSSRALLGRDLDHPPAPDCSVNRYSEPDPATLPTDYDASDYKLTADRDSYWANSPHQLCGSKGAGVDLAWGVTRGRPDVVIAVLDSGVQWRNGSASDLKDLADQAYLNPGELPKPWGSSTYDANGDGVFNVEDYAHDPRVTDRNHNGILDPEDLILTPAFNNHVDNDHDGYVDDISGWDFLYNDNDPLDDVDYGHGTGEARDSTAEADNGGSVGTCPDCRFLPVRVGDSFIAEGGRFAAGVLFALDSKASIVQEALGTINNPSQAQMAVDAAYNRGVPIVASMADESSEHANLPAVLNHTIPVNSVTSTYGFLGSASSLVHDQVLSLNGCTNYGPITWVSVPSDSCSSQATGLSAGMVGLMESEAKNTGLSPPLSANEVAQLLRGTADDIDFSTPEGKDPANDPGPPGFARYPTTPGWDATFGYGRVNVYQAVRAVQNGEIPPEADISSPSWFDVLPITGTVPVTGTVAARRSSSYSYKVQWTTGLQAPPYPGGDTWHTVASVSGQTAAHSGQLATLNLAQIAAALPNGGHGGSSTAAGQPDQDRFAVRVRVVVTDAQGRVGVAQRQVFVHDDPDIVTALTHRVAGAGGPSPTFANIDGKPGDELIVPTDDGTIHAYRADGSEVPGWPVHTGLAAWWPSKSPTAIADHIPPAHDAIGVGAPVVADLNGDGSVEIASADTGGHVTVWDHNGHQLARMSTDPNYSLQSAHDPDNRMKPGILAQVAAGDLNGDGHLELVVAAMDRHVYAWHPDGRPVPGFPVLVVDPREVKSVDPVTNKITFKTLVDQGGELSVTPAVGDINGDGKAEIIVGAQEEYPEPVAVAPAIGLPGTSGNTREYAIWGDGTDHPHAVDKYPADPSEQAYLPGWPVSLAMIKTEVLPVVGDGVNTQAAIGDVNGDGKPEVVVTSAAGPVYVLDQFGRSTFLPALGQQIALQWLGSTFGALATSHDGGLVTSAFGGPSLGNLSGDAAPEIAAPTVGFGKALDELLPGKQPGDTQLMAWDGRTSLALPGFPHTTSDLAFFVTPAIADVDGDGHNEVIAANGVDLLDAVNANGVEAPGYPKVTGGWAVGTPALGDPTNSGTAEIAITRRDGVLEVWRTKTPDSGLNQWPRFGHDNLNSGDYATPTSR